MGKNIIENLENAAHTLSLKAVYGEKFRTKRPLSPKLTDPIRMQEYVKNLANSGSRETKERYVRLYQELVPLDLLLPNLSSLLTE